VARVRVDDKPDVLWDHGELTRLNTRLTEEFELAERSAALDRKLSLVGDTVQTLLALMESRRSLVLEVAVAVFIGIELAATLWGLFTG
jgi:required for meiotic nuclear division protein 1